LVDGETPFENKSLLPHEKKKSTVHSF